MSLRGLLWPDGRLTDIAGSTEARDGAELAEVEAMPSGYGPLAYDRESRRAIPHAALLAARTQEQARTSRRRDREERNHLYAERSEEIRRLMATGMTKAEAEAAPSVRAVQAQIDTVEARLG